MIRPTVNHTVEPERMPIEWYVPPVLPPPPRPVRIEVAPDRWQLALMLILGIAIGVVATMTMGWTP